MSHLKIDQDKCLGSGQCAYLQPALFTLADDGTPEVIHASPVENMIARAQDAIAMCPAQAISLEEGDPTWT